MRNFFLIVLAISLFIGCKSTSDDIRVAMNDGSGEGPSYISDTLSGTITDVAIYQADSLHHQKVMVLSSNESLYTYDMQGKKVEHSIGKLDKPVSLTVQQDFIFQDTMMDILAIVEEKTKLLKVYQLPSYERIDDGTIELFKHSENAIPTQIDIYKRASDNTYWLFASQSSGNIWQYILTDNTGELSAYLVNKFEKTEIKGTINDLKVDDDKEALIVLSNQKEWSKVNANPEQYNKLLSNYTGDTEYQQVDFHQGDSLNTSVYTLMEKGGLALMNRDSSTFSIHKRISNEDIQSITRIQSGYINEDFPYGLLVTAKENELIYYRWEVLLK